MHCFNTTTLNSAISNHGMSEGFLTPTNIKYLDQQGSKNKTCFRVYICVWRIASARFTRSVIFRIYLQRKNNIVPNEDLKILHIFRLCCHWDISLFFPLLFVLIAVMLFNSDFLPSLSGTVPAALYKNHFHRNPILFFLSFFLLLLPCISGVK